MSELVLVGDTMECLFCHAHLLHEKVGYSWVSFACQSCEARFWWAMKSKTRGRLNDYRFCYGTYLINYNLENGRFVILDKSSGKYVVSLDFLPDITPQNFAHKLPTLLTFS